MPSVVPDALVSLIGYDLSRIEGGRSTEFSNAFSGYARKIKGWVGAITLAELFNGFTVEERYNLIELGRLFFVGGHENG
jgi:hypothetical protein